MFLSPSLEMIDAELCSLKPQSPVNSVVIHGAAWRPFIATWLKSEYHKFNTIIFISTILI